MDNDGYLTLLDSLARYYNSQITAHVGYLISVFALAFGGLIAVGTSLVLRTESDALTLGPLSIGDTYMRVGVPVILLGLLFLWILGGLPYSLKYLVGRTQYYIGLSQIVFEHMGLETRHGDPIVQTLRERALKDNHGIDHAIVSLFEGRLFVSRCKARGKGVHYHPMNLRLFNVTSETAVHADYFPSPILVPRILAPGLGFIMRNLVFLAYKRRTDGYYKAKDRRGYVLKEVFSPWCPKHGNYAPLLDLGNRFYCPQEDHEVAREEVTFKCDGKAILKDLLLTNGYSEKRILGILADCKGNAESWYVCKIKKKGSAECVTEDLILCDNCKSNSADKVLTISRAFSLPCLTP